MRQLQTDLTAKQSTQVSQDRPVTAIRRDLETALAYQERYQGGRKGMDTRSVAQFEANQEEIRQLEDELSHAMAARGASEATHV